MNSSSNGNDAGILFGIVIVLIFGFITYKLMGVFDVPWDIALKSGIGLVMWVIGLCLLIFAIFYHDDAWVWLAPGYVWLIIAVFNPILKYIAGVREYAHFQPKIEWYGETWILVLSYFALSAITYFALYKWKERY